MSDRLRWPKHWDDLRVPNAVHVPFIEAQQLFLDTVRDWVATLPR